MKKRWMWDYTKLKVVSTLKSQAKKNYLGYVWWVLEPLMMMAVYYFVFGVLFQRGGEGFELQLMVGVIVWLWFGSSVPTAMTSILNAKGVMHRVYIPKYVLVAISLGVNIVKQAIILSLLLLLLVILGKMTVVWLYFPAILLAQFIFVCAVGSFLAAIIPFFPDLRLPISPILTTMMFCSGIFYLIEDLSPDIQKYMLLNPMANLIKQYRDVLLNGEPPSILSLAIISICSLLVALYAFFIMRKYDRYYPQIVY